MGFFSTLGSALRRELSLSAQRVSMRADLALAQVTSAIVRASNEPKSKIELTQIVPINVSTWSFDDVRAALETHELGYFLNSAALCDAFGRDDRISACLNTRVQALVGKGGAAFSVEPSETTEDTAYAQELADRVADWWRYGISETTLARIHRDAVMLGVAFARIHWDMVDGERVPRLEPWDAHAVYWDWGSRRYIAVAQEGAFAMEPGDGRWFVFEPAGRRSWMSGAVRALGIPYVFRGFTQRDWARYCEKHGLPILAVREPQGAQFNAAKASFYAKLRQLGKEAVVRLPMDRDGKNGFGLDIIEPKDTSWESFKEFLLRLDINIAVHLLGQNLTTEAGTNGGSHAAVKGANSVRLDYLASDAEALSTQLREQVVKPWMAFNVDEDDQEVAPWPRWATQPDGDMLQKAQVFYTYAEGVDKLASMPDAVAIDYDELARELELPLRTDRGVSPGEPETSDEEKEAETDASPSPAAVEEAARALGELRGRIELATARAKRERAPRRALRRELMSIVGKRPAREFARIMGNATVLGAFTPEQMRRSA